MKDIDWASIAEPVARELLGEPNPHLQRQARAALGAQG